MADMEGYAEAQARLAALGNVQLLLGRLGLVAVNKAKELVPRRTGNLGRTIRLGTVTDHSVTIVAGGDQNVGYAGVVEFGSKPHVINARRKKALMFSLNPTFGRTGNTRLSGSVRTPFRTKAGRAAANVIFRKSVHHPGTRPHPYLVPAVNYAIEVSGSELIKAWNEAGGR